MNNSDFKEEGQTPPAIQSPQNPALNRVNELQ